MKSPQFEQFLDNQGVAWHYEEEIELDAIDARKGLMNQARLEEPLNEDVVRRYTGAYIRGDKFPPMILWRPHHRSRYIPCDGNTRYAAMVKSKKVKTTDAYVLDTTDELIINRITFQANMINGIPLTHETRMEHAKYDVRTLGHSAKQAALDYGLVLSTLIGQIRCEEIKDVLARHAIPTDKLSTRQLIDLGPLATIGEDVLVKGTQLVLDFGVGQEDLNHLVRKVKRAKTYPEKLAVLDEYAKSKEVVTIKAETKGGKINATKDLPRRRQHRLLIDAEKLLDSYPDDAGLRPPKADFKREAEIAEMILNRWIKIYSLGRVVTDGDNGKEE